MTTIPQQRTAHLWRWIKLRNAQGDLLLVALAAMAAAMLLTNNYDLAPRLFWIAFLPAALVWQGGVTLDVAWPRMRLSTSFVFRLGFSLIIVAIAIYLIALDIATARQPGLARRVMDSQWLFTAEILFFIAVIAHAVALIEGFLPRMIAVLAPLAALNAAINAFSFLMSPPSEDLPEWRLINWLGMPGYTNSTNISMTYAMFFLASAAILTSRASRRAMRLWLAPWAAILFVGMVLTHSRGAFIATAAGAVVLIVIRYELAFWRRHAIKFAAGLVIIALALAAIPRVRDIATRRGEGYRPEIWQIYLKQAGANPLRGTGSLANIDITLSHGLVIDQPHNLVLSAQVRGGLFCALAMIGMLTASLWAAIRYRLRRDGSVPLAVIVSILAAGMFDYNLLVTPATWPWLTFWLPFAICAGAEIALHTKDVPEKSLVGDVGLEPTTR